MPIVLYVLTFSLLVSCKPVQAQQLADSLTIFNSINRRNSSSASDACNIQALHSTPVLGQERTYFTYSSATPPPFSHLDCRHFDINWFCERIQAWAPHVVTNTYIQTRRQSDRSLRRKVFAHVSNFFRTALISDEILESCCGPTEPRSVCGTNCARNRECQQRLSQTDLKIIPATSPSDATAHYDVDSNQIRLSESILLNSLTQETNERIVLHELGHACQFSRHSILGSNHWSVVLDTSTVRGCDSDVGGFSDFLEVLPGVAACLRGPLTHAASNWHSSRSEKPCRNSWAMEAFADSIFAFYRRSPMMWNWNCQADVDVLHGPSRIAIECLLSQAPSIHIAPRPNILESICSPDRL